MLSKSLKIILLIAAVVLMASGITAAFAQSFRTDQIYPRANAPAFISGEVYSQPIDPVGKLIQSSEQFPDGSDLDQHAWDNFTISSDQVITEIDWAGGYDPLKLGAGGAVMDFTVAIYPSIAGGSEPAVAFPPLVTYQTGGNAGEAMIGTFGSITMYSYAFVLPAPFTASAGVKYWVNIIAQQPNLTPDWGLAWATGGDGSHYHWFATSPGGDSIFRFMPGDVAFTLIGPTVDTATPTDTPTDTPTNTPTDTPTSTSTNTPTNTPTDTPTNTPTDTPTNTPTNTSTNTPTNTSTNTPTDTPTSTPTFTPTFTPTNTPTDTPTFTPTNTPTNTATFTPTYTATNTPTNTPTPEPLKNTPGKVTGGGEIGSNVEPVRATFGFTISYRQGDSEPKGNLVYQDHKTKITLKATSFDLLVINGDAAWFTGKGMTDDGKVVSFTVQVDGSSDSFSISIPALDGYGAGGPVSGGNVTVHK